METAVQQACITECVFVRAAATVLKLLGIRLHIQATLQEQKGHTRLYISLFPLLFHSLSLHLLTNAYTHTLT